MRSRRTFFVLAGVALGIVVATAGVAAAGSDGSRGGRAATTLVVSGRGERAHGAGDARTGHDGTANRQIEHGDRHGSPTPLAGPSAMGAVGSSHTPAGVPPGGVTGTSAGSPAPVEAPVAAANGPAPVAAATAPNSVAPAAVVHAPTHAPAATPAATVDPNAIPAAQPSSAPTPVPTPVPSPVATPAPGPDLSVLGALGSLAPPIADERTAVRSVLTTTTGRSVVTVIAVLIAMVLFLSMHRRLDRNDPKLASASAQADVARFR